MTPPSNHPPTLDEWAKSTVRHRLLQANLRVNIEVYLDEACELKDKEVIEELKASLLRANLIRVRQFVGE